MLHLFHFPYPEVAPSCFPSKIKPVKFSGQFLSEFFNEGKSTEEIEMTVAEALRMYLNKQDASGVIETQKSTYEHT